MGAKSIIAGLLTVLLVLAGVYYFTDKGKNFSLFSKRTKTTVTKQTGTTTSDTFQDSVMDLRGKGQVIIEMVGSKFNPQTATVTAGTIVTWKNNDTVSHVIKTDAHANPGVFGAQNSNEIRSGEMYSIKFDAAGSYNYRCGIHADSGMTGQIVVE